MSGAITLSTIAAIASAGVAAGGLAYGIKSGSDQSNAQDQALKRQKAAQVTAEQNAVSQARKSDTAQNAANQKTPDIASILQRASQSGKAGMNSTMLTGTSGIDPTQLNLGKTTLLGS
jgi:hypothetical protein